MFARFIVAIAAAIVIAAPQPAAAKMLKYHVALDGHYGSEPSGSAATGRANVSVDTDTHRVSVELDVTGLSVDNLWDRLVAAPVGPIHFHKYATIAGGDSELALPLPFGLGYRPTPGGMHVSMKDYDYDTGAALLKSTLTFDDFVAAMDEGLIVLNIHTDKFNAGEISGLVVPD
jgi:hypothetical protein